MMDYFKYGQEAQQEFNRNQENSERIWRFFLQKGQTGQILFLDGKYDKKKDCFVDLPGFYQHTFLGQKSLNGNYPCLIGIDDSDTCPLCDAGSAKQFVLVSTVIHLDHITNDGDVKQVKKLFYLSKMMIDSLSVPSKKRGGCINWVVDVMRSKGKKTTYVFDFVEKSDKELLSTIKDLELSPYDYSKVIKITRASELYALGVIPPPVGDTTFLHDEDESKENEEDFNINF